MLFSHTTSYNNVPTDQPIGTGYPPRGFAQGQDQQYSQRIPMPTQGTNHLMGQETIWDKIHYLITWFLNFFFSFVLTAFFVVTLLYWPYILKEITYWWHSNYEAPREQTQQQQEPVINPVYPDDITTINNTVSAEPNVPIIPPDNRVVIEKATVNAPIVSILEQDRNNEQVVLSVIEKGVGWYDYSAEPGEPGNMVLTGHSSYFWWKPGDYKFVFSNLWKLPIGEVVTIYWKGKKYDYTIFNSKIIEPNTTDRDWIFSQVRYQNESILTLITCHPPGTALKRLIVQARLTNPAFDPKSDIPLQDYIHNELPMIW